MNTLTNYHRLEVKPKMELLMSYDIGSLKIDITNQRAAFWVEEGIKDGKDQSEGIILGGGGT